MSPEEYNNNLFPFLSAPKETLLIPSKPKTSVGPEPPQTKPGNLQFVILEVLLWYCLSYISAVTEFCGHGTCIISRQKFISLFSQEFVHKLYQNECPRIESISMESSWMGLVAIKNVKNSINFNKKYVFELTFKKLFSLGNFIILNTFDSIS